MAFEAILAEAEQLHNVSNRLEALAKQHPPVSAALMTISGSVRNTATASALAKNNQVAPFCSDQR
jgi:hypothetical protein